MPYARPEGQATAQVQGRLLDLEQPDLVIFSGDQVSGYALPEGRQKWFEARCAP